MQLTTKFEISHQKHEPAAPELTHRLRACLLCSFSYNQEHATSYGAPACLNCTPYCHHQKSSIHVQLVMNSSVCCRGKSQAAAGEVKQEAVSSSGAGRGRGSKRKSSAASDPHPLFANGSIKAEPDPMGGEGKLDMSLLAAVQNMLFIMNAPSRDERLTDGCM